jgi:hypothetical protein
VNNLARPIFVIGSYRSGTSVLTWALGQHSNILPLEETNWIYRLGVDLDHLFELGTCNGYHSHLTSMGMTKTYFYEKFGQFINSFILEHTEHIINHSNSLIERYSLDSDFYKVRRGPNDPKARWVDGTPENSHYVYGLSLLFPEAKFIHILRNPKKVARSLMNFSTVGQADYPEEIAYLTWKRLVSDCVLAEKALGSNKVLRVTQEDLEKDPEATLRLCLSFLGEDYEANCLLPLKTRINSSTYVHDFDVSIETNLKSEKWFERECFEFYKAITEDSFTTPDPVAYNQMKKKFEEICLNQNPNEINRVLTRQEEKILNLEKKLAMCSPMVITSFGPEDINAGEAFNVQPDGSNAIWIAGKNITAGAQVYLDSFALESTVVSENLITAKVPVELTREKGILKIQLFDKRLDIYSNSMEMTIK